MIHAKASASQPTLICEVIDSASATMSTSRERAAGLTTLGIIGFPFHDLRMFRVTR